jgi:cytoskeleton protein RodZ
MDIGTEFRAAREAKGLSLDTIAERTRVPARMLAAIERNDRPALPPHPFDRGFVRTYAVDVGLDPDRLVRDFFAQFPTLPAAAATTTARHDEPWQVPSRWLGMAGAVAVLLIVVTAAVVLGRRGERAPEPNSVGTSGAVAATPPSTATGSSPQPAPSHPDGAAASPTASQEATGAIRIVLAMSRPCWVAATVDGRRTIYRTLKAGERETIVAEREVRLRFGDAGAVTWTINGRDAGPAGANGAIRDLRVTGESLKSDVGSLKFVR